MPWVLCIVSNIVLASLVALAAWFVQRRMQLPGIARLLWLLVLVKLVTPPLVRIPIVDLPGALACTLVLATVRITKGLYSLSGTGSLSHCLWPGWSEPLLRGVLAWRHWCYFQRLLALRIACACPVAAVGDAAFRKTFHSPTAGNFRRGRSIAPACGSWLAWGTHAAARGIDWPT